MALSVLAHLAAGRNAIKHFLCNGPHHAGGVSDYHGKPAHQPDFASDLLTATPASVGLFDPTGRLQKQASLPAGSSYILNLAGLPAGVWLLQVAAGPSPAASRNSRSRRDE